VAEAGIQMDSLIARKVWRVFVVSDSATGESYMVDSDTGEKVAIPAFSTDIDEAHRVVEFFQTKGWAFRVKHIPENDVYHAMFFKDDGRTYKFIAADTMPLAVCIAALACLGGLNISY